MIKHIKKKYLLTHVHLLISGVNIELQSCLEHYRQVTPGAPGYTSFISSQDASLAML